MCFPVLDSIAEFAHLTRSFSCVTDYEFAFLVLDSRGLVDRQGVVPVVTPPCSVSALQVLRRYRSAIFLRATAIVAVVAVVWVRVPA